jgi:NADPH:quinone reductase-like Zn-dependent oxidoreductase
VPGIEAVGEIDDANGSELAPGQQVATMMGNMGRTFDGGYAEFTVVPRRQVIPFHSTLPWQVLGAIPETLQTAYGSLTTGLDLQRGQSLLIRGGTSSVGLAAAALAKDIGATVLSTTRQPDRVDILGADHAIVDTGTIAPAVRALFPHGVDAALELVGTPTLPDTLASTRVHGTVCFTGMLSNQWIVPNFYPIGYLPQGVRLTAYGGESDDLPAAVLQRYLDRLAANEVSFGPIRVYTLDQIREAHADMEQNRGVGKMVVTL